jgi:two-component system, NtrC family, sensor kinase
MRIPFNRLSAIYCLLPLLFIAQLGFAQGKPSVKWGRLNLLAFDTTWKYHDGPAKQQFFESDYDDHDWQTVKNDFLQNLPGNITIRPILAVFRKKFNVPDSLKNRRFELFVDQFGASEIYLDGKLVYRFGSLTEQSRDEIILQKAVQLVLDSQSSHLLAIYYSSHIRESVISRFDLINYDIALSPLVPQFDNTMEPSPHALVSLSIILVFCLFFCFVYGFYPYRLASLMSALMLANFSLIFLAGVVDIFTSVNSFIITNDLWQIGFTLNPGWNLLFLYSLYYRKLPKRSWIPAGLMIVSVPFVLYYSPFPFHIIVPLLALYQIESWRILILGIRNKRTGFWILFIGEAISIFGSLISIFDLFNFFPWYLTTTQTVLAIVTDLSFPLTLALQLAWEFGSANRDLRRQLAQVSDLSNKNLEQEKEKQQILASQNEMLEKQVAERTFQVVSQKEEIEKQRDQVTTTLGELRATQNQLIQSEKMASLGELTAGIAHEIQNPLNFVNNFSEVNTELIDEMKKEIDAGNMNQIKSITADLQLNTEKITHHGKRADAIVKGMLQHSRKSTGLKEPTDINALAAEYLRLSYQGLRARDKTFNAGMETRFDESIGKINIVPQDLGRVLLNLYNNAFYAISERAKQESGRYEPTVTVSTKKLADYVVISVMDNGTGIPQKVLDKIFQPFFTTKPTGQGTGLGLSLSYDIVKAHGGELNVNTKEGLGTEFVIRIPVT